MRKTQILMNKPVCLDLSILDLSKTVMYELQYDYAKLCCMDTDKWYLIIHQILTFKTL